MWCPNCNKYYKNNGKHYNNHIAKCTAKEKNINLIKENLYYNKCVKLLRDIKLKGIKNTEKKTITNKIYSLYNNISSSYNNSKFNNQFFKMYNNKYLHKILFNGVGILFATIIANINNDNKDNYYEQNNLSLEEEDKYKNIKNFIYQCLLIFVKKKVDVKISFR